jgi:surface polysaccharide O-acyltransferase-like enzyme
LQQGTLASSRSWTIIAQSQNSNVLIYQFYFVLGGFTALYFQRVRSFLLRYGWVVACAFLAALAGLWLHYVLQIRVYQESIGYATSVLQPVMVFYSLAVVLFAFWLACLWAGRKNQDGRPRGYRLWHTLSDASFGVYLIHALLLTAILKWVVPAMPALWPVALRVFLTWFMTVASATAITVLLLNIPVLSHLVGREHAAKRNAVQAAKEERHEKQPQQTEMTYSASRGEQAMLGVVLGKKGAE